MLQIHKRIDGAIYQILKQQNGSTAIFIKNFKHLTMTNVCRNIECDVEKFLNKI
jgi:hypothetical protein